MKFKPVYVILSVLILATILGFSLRVQQTALVNSNQLDQSAENLYHYAILPELTDNPAVGRGNPTQWITEGHYVFSERSSISVGNSRFEIVMSNLRRNNRAGSECATLLFDAQIFKDGTLIDSISGAQFNSASVAQNRCNLATETPIRAYTTDGQVIKSPAQDFFPIPNRNDIKVPANKDGILVNFAIVIWEDGAPLDLRKMHVVNEITPVYAANTITIRNVTFTRASNSSINIEVEADSRYAFKGNIEIISSPGIGIDNKIGESGLIDIAQGSRRYVVVLPLRNDEFTIRVVPKIVAYEATSRLSNLNGRTIFLNDDHRRVSSADYSYYKVGEFVGSRIRLSTEGGTIVYVINQTTVYVQNETVRYVNQTQVVEHTVIVHEENFITRFWNKVKGFFSRLF